MDFVDKTIDYLRSSKAELEKVAWPSKQDTIRFSALVIGASVVMAVFFGVMDRVFMSAVETVLTSRPATHAVTNESNAPPQPIELNPSNVEVVTQSSTPASVINVQGEQKPASPEKKP